MKNPAQPNRKLSKWHCQGIAAQKIDGFFGDFSGKRGAIEQEYLLTKKQAIC